jgi:hypothetical protein
MCNHQQAMLAKQRPQTFLSYQSAENSNYVGGISSLELVAETSCCESTC